MFQNSVHFCSSNDKVISLRTSFLEKDEMVFHLAAISQCEEGGEGHIWDSTHAFLVKSIVSEGSS
jgi:hypothetical protein